ncbi:Myotubularin-related protein 6 [Echinococcus granulosus]|uniref:Protein tyrosine phosphatase active site n=1 Tax=Echinococcus granulosus TaxID=6210 RepID=A0A068WK91_ECHGR|nr:Myotubularin-related protein 6 [Echinococcus granulosus]CDS18029.1 protein tyrosine phosphatase active site [Echinococcus granulosus]
MHLPELSKFENITFVDCFNGYAWIQGVLHITHAHTFFVDNSKKHELRIQTCLIDSVERLPLAATGAPLIIRGKNFRVACFLLPHDRDCQKVYETLTNLTQVPSIKHLPCFREWPSGLSLMRGEGWNFFDLRTDFARMGLPNASWIVVDNNHYQICDTYPSILFVPKQANYATLLGSANFRSRKRLPVLTWIHPNGRSVLCRSSQPLSGLASKSTGDQLLLRDIRLAAACATTASGVGSMETPPLLYVVDTRPLLNALTNRAQGKGYEVASIYRDIIFRFVEIPNIHAVRGSMEKMLKAYQNPRVTLKDLNATVDKSSWLRNLRRIVDAAFFVASRMQPEAGGYSFLVHCSDGWDRTSQVCALAQLLIDPFYRTLEGFQALVEKDWLCFGHKFGDRCGQTQEVDAREVSPIFTQFLDCTRHLVDLLPTAFEFNTRFLMALHDHSRSGRFGTFVGCSEKQRRELGLAAKTCSSWVYFAAKRYVFTNPLYTPTPKYVKAKKIAGQPHVTALLPAFVASPHLFGMWSDLYLRHEWRIPSLSQRMIEAMNNLKTQTLALSAHSDRLRQCVRELSKLLGKSDDEIRNLLNLTEKAENNLCLSNAKGSEKRHNDVNNESNQNSLDNLKRNRLTREAITRDLGRVNTRLVNSLIPPTAACCPVCSVLLISRTPCVICTVCGNLVCSICHIFLNIIPGVETKLPLCRTCHRKTVLKEDAVI